MITRREWLATAMAAAYATSLGAAQKTETVTLVIDGMK
jgi:hypothetical protein